MDIVLTAEYVGMPTVDGVLLATTIAVGLGVEKLLILNTLVSFNPVLFAIYILPLASRDISEGKKSDVEL